MWVYRKAYQDGTDAIMQLGMSIRLLAFLVLSRTITATKPVTPFTI